MPQGKIGIEDLGQELKNKINKTIDIADGVENGDFTYVHPNDSQTRHVTDLEKATWNDKADKKVATSSEHGLMSNDDKIKLDGIAVNANNYSHPGTHPASMISIADTSNLFTATDVEGALKEVFTNANNGKSSIANAINGAGGSANNSMTFNQLATAITGCAKMKSESGSHYVTFDIESASTTTSGSIPVSFSFKPKLLIVDTFHGVRMGGNFDCVDIYILHNMSSIGASGLRIRVRNKGGVTANDISGNAGSMTMVTSITDMPSNITWSFTRQPDNHNYINSGTFSDTVFWHAFG